MAPTIISDLSLLNVASTVFADHQHLQNCLNPNQQSSIVRNLRRALLKIDRSKERFNKIQNAFLAKYRVRISTNRNQVRFIIPQGVSIYELLRDAQTISLICRGVVAIYPPRLNKWGAIKDFTKRQKEDLARVVLPIVKDSEFRTRLQQQSLLRKCNLRMATAAELAAAHACFSTLVNSNLTDLFDGNILRVKGTKLYYGDGGLSEMDESDYVNNCRYKNVKVAGVKC